ncbi:LysE family translocator [Aurantibacillus circumpalustris]|uniref:LysE family translocator n=1 Tax=Aurantibacillus circumpalustris TaxID=3036359 RepID=UPI00295B3EE0|nr:LysE family transporter [Aurantibacillus circumpalustris]
MILSLISQTIVIVLLLTFSFGPAFFALINTGITHGYKTGSLLAVGVVASDFLLCLLMIFLIHFGASNFIHDEKSQRFMGILAGIVLIVFGALHFKEPIPKKDDVIEIIIPSAKAMIIKGFFLNCLNPAVWLLWLGNVTAVSKTLNYNVLTMILYFSITLGLVLLVELGKVSVAGKLKQILTPKTMYVINVITGGLLVIFGLVLIYNHFFETV